MKVNLLDKWIHFDSQMGSEIEIDLIGNQPWIAQVTSIYFETEVGWDDDSAFLMINMTSATWGNLITQQVSKPRGVILPIRNPISAKRKIDVYFKGPATGKDILEFSVLGSDLQPVKTDRVIVTLHIFADQGQILTK
jgi:hypothetical protein